MLNVPIANWWAGLLATGAVALLAACFIVQLREWNIRPLFAASRWLRRPWLERGLLLFLVCGMVQYASTKGTGNADPQSDAEVDGDADGLINLHELWAGCDPQTPDGSNTVLSVAARSIDDRIRGLNATNALPIFENYITNGNQNVFVANTNCWLYGIDHSCASPWQDGGVRWQWAGTLVSSRHMITAAHFTNWSGTRYWFRGRSGEIYVRTMVSTKRIGATDICVNLLNEALPDDVVPASVMPVNLGRYLRTGFGLPMVCFDQEEKALVHEVSSLGVDAESYEIQSSATVRGRMPTDAQRLTFYEPLISGDSGNPRFLLLNDRLVLVNVTHTGGASTGDLVSAHIQEIDDAMNELAGTSDVYHLRQADLSGFEPLVDVGSEIENGGL